MSEMEEQAASPIPVVIGGQEYRLMPLRFLDHAEAARRMRRDWTEPSEVLDRIGKGLTEAQTQQLLDIAYREQREGGGADLRALWRWYRTPLGILVRLWLMLRRCHPELTLDEVDELLLRASGDELEELARVGREARGGSDQHAVFPWRQMFRELRDRYGWTPNQIAEMTIAQIFMHWTEIEHDAVTEAAMSRDEAIAGAQSRKKRRDQWMKEMRGRLDHDD